MRPVLFTVETRLGLAGRVVVVAEGTGWLGLVIASKLCDNGAQVVLIHDDSEPALGRAAQVVGSRTGGYAIEQVAVEDDTALIGLLERVHDRYGRLDAFVYPLRFQRPMSTARPDVRALHAELAMAIDPMLAVSDRLAAMMGDGGRIVVVAAEPVRPFVQRSMAYQVIKNAMAAVVRCLAMELAPCRVTVNAISTDRLDLGPMAMYPELVAELAARAPAGRLTTPEDVANALALLCTQEASWITGHVLTLDEAVGPMM